MKIPIFVFSVILACMFTSCNSDFAGYKITVGNPNDLKRNAQTIEIALNQLTGLTSENFDQLSVKDNQGNILLSQLIDSNGDSISDYIIFQSDFEAQETLSFYITINSDVVLMNQGLKRTYCRFVPERMDDFAWENDKVAFRTYGPACQKLFEDGKPGGLISSGIDCWLKRVDYPIIDKWYKKNEAGGSYHVDDGEGLDNYHVGTTRGCGGTAIIEDGEYLLSENYHKWEIIANGPIRSVFKLEYPALKVGDREIQETKTISIDLGCNFYRCDVNYTEKVKQAGVGIAHHNTKGKLLVDNDKNYMTYWEALDDSYLGTAIIVNNKEVESMMDSENNWLNVALNDKSFNYWAGYGWKKAGQFSTSEDWEKFVNNQSTIKHTPLKIKIE